MAIDPLPRISIVIVTYNFGRCLRECIESVLSQTLEPFEIVICDDHSTDNSWAIIKEYSQQYPRLIKAYQHEQNMGPYYNGAFGVKVASGDLVSFIEGDDRWLPQKLELEWKALQRHPEAQIAYSNVYTIDAEGNRTGIWYYDGKGPAPPSGDVFIEVFSRRVFHNTRKTFRNELVRRLAHDEEGRGKYAFVPLQPIDLGHGNIRSLQVSHDTHLPPQVVVGEKGQRGRPAEHHTLRPGSSRFPPAQIEEESLSSESFRSHSHTRNREILGLGHLVLQPGHELRLYFRQVHSR